LIQSMAVTAFVHLIRECDTARGLTARFMIPSREHSTR
jgi:hypothetical protein